MIFRDREDGGVRLAEALKSYQGSKAVVLALPRGGVVTGAVTAKALKLPLGLVIPRKIGAPGNPEYAIGAITEDGDGVWNEMEKAQVDSVWLKEEIKKEQTEAKRRREAYLAGQPVPSLLDKIVIIVDDGVATGLTMRAAIKHVRKQKPKKIVVAVPVSPPDSVELLKKEADEVVVLSVPEWFGAIGAYYENFPQLQDEEVVKLMKSV